MLSGNKYNIKQSLAEKFDGIIWKVEIDGVLPLIAIESRDAGSRTSNISLFNFETGECMFRESAVEDSWNWNLAGVQNGIVFLHGYLGKETPEHNGIIALSSNGNIQWSAYNRALLSIADDGLLVYDPRTQPRRHEVLDLSTGSIISRTADRFPSTQRDIVLPDFYANPGTIPVVLPGNTVGEIAYLHFNNKDIVAYHIKNENSYTQQLLITQGAECLLKENLTFNVLKVNPEAFFLSRSHLFCIRDEKREIVSYLV